MKKRERGNDNKTRLKELAKKAETRLTNKPLQNESYQYKTTLA